MSMGSQGGTALTEENRITRRKPCPSAILFTANPTRTEPSGLQGESPATNRLSHGTAKFQITSNVDVGCTGCLNPRREDCINLCMEIVECTSVLSRETRYADRYGRPVALTLE
jgi:hypothetical protein